MVVILCQQRHQQSTKIVHWVEQVTYKMAIAKRPPLFQIPVLPSLLLPSSPIGNNPYLNLVSLFYGSS